MVKSARTNALNWLLWIGKEFSLFEGFFKETLWLVCPRIILSPSVRNQIKATTRFALDSR